MKNTYVLPRLVKNVSGLVTSASEFFTFVSFGKTTQLIWIKKVSILKIFG